MRMLTTLTVVTLSALTLGIAASNAQTAKQETCGVETWSTDKMAYVSVPCTETQQPSGQVAAKPGAANSNAKCGVETWSTDKMTYEMTPCNAGTTSENPGATQ